LILPEPADVADLDRFLTRASSVRDGVCRLVARGQVLALHVAGAFPLMLGSASPTIIGQRGVRLARPAELDVVVPIAELRDRLARLTRQGEGALDLDVPPSRPNAPWTATLPLASRWEAVGQAHDDTWVAAARRVASEVQDSLPTDPGQPLVFAARDAAWGREEPELGPGVIAGAAFLAHAYGFLREGATSSRFTSGAWERLSSPGGTLLWRTGR
jgi:hypothetical protein